MIKGKPLDNVACGLWSVVFLCGFSSRGWRSGGGGGPAPRATSLMPVPSRPFQPEPVHRLLTTQKKKKKKSGKFQSVTVTFETVNCVFYMEADHLKLKVVVIRNYIKYIGYVIKADSSSRFNKEDTFIAFFREPLRSFHIYFNPCAQKLEKPFSYVQFKDERKKGRKKTKERVILPHKEASEKEKKRRRQT